MLSTLIGNNRTEGRMKSNVCAASHWNWSGRPRHHIMIAAAVIRIFMADRPNHRKFVRYLRQFWHGFTEADSWDRRGDGAKATPNL